MPSETTRPQAEVRTITVDGKRLLVAIRKGDGTRTPLLLLNGIGVNLEELQIPRAKLYIFHDGHLGLGTNARELAQIVEQFLAAPVSFSTSSV